MDKQAGTKVCLVCRKPAQIYGGHVHYGNGQKTQHILTGWCREHGPYTYDMIGGLSYRHEKCGGCYGDWQEWMGFIVL